MDKIQCDNCGCREDWVDMWQCPECQDWICLEESEQFDGWPNCMIHDDGLCADCCSDDCGICAMAYCDDCEEHWTDCECDDD